MSSVSMMFSSSSSLVSQRVEALREAESKLLEFARTRFAPPNSPSTANENDHEFELIDTPIPKSAIPMKEKKECHCQVLPTTKSSDKDLNDDDTMYRMHGIKVTNKHFSKDDNISNNTGNNLNSSEVPPLVLLHGYANGCLYFYRNLMGLSQLHFPTIYALDMLGWGLSSRPKFEPILPSSQSSSALQPQEDSSKSKKPVDGAIISEESRNNVLSAENFFVESLEAWRQSHKIPKMILAGHSMGGYLSVAYAERYPEHVERLILLSPVGVPERSPEDDRTINSLPFYMRGMLKTVRWLYEMGATPGSFLRSLPTYKSKQLVDSYIENRLPAINRPDEQKFLSQYLYMNSMLPGSGEYGLNPVLQPGAFAKLPLVHRIPDLKVKEVHFVYGENDWMDYKGGLEVQQQCWEKNRAERSKQPQTQHQSEKFSSNANLLKVSPRVQVYGVKDAGHLLMLDNYEEFNSALIIAAGGENSLPSASPRPVEFICSPELASYITEDVTDAERRKRKENSEAAAIFFRGGRWARRFQKEGSDANESFGEEKKVEERLT